MLFPESSERNRIKQTNSFLYSCLLLLLLSRCFMSHDAGEWLSIPYHIDVGLKG